MKIRNLLDLSLPELSSILAAWSVPAYRVRQVVEWIYQKRATSFAQCTNLPLDLRERLAQSFLLRSLSLEKKEVSHIDSTVRYTFTTQDGLSLSTVFMPQGDRNSLCISSQIGCPVGCSFCHSGALGFKRNLSGGEILEQVLQVEQDAGKKADSILLMGMGEPMLNYDNMVYAVKAMVDPRRLGISRRHVTVSTVGYVPQIRKFATEYTGVRLALSLHAADDVSRKKFIANVPYGLGDILLAGLEYAREANARLTLEYILVSGVNDSLQDAERLVKLINRSALPDDEIRVNLIPCNTIKAASGAGQEQQLRPPERVTVRHFQEYLADHGVVATIRQARGADIDAACGQLGF